MSDAVAKLRFDLLADTGKMTGPLADAGTAAEKMAARFNKKLRQREAVDAAGRTGGRRLEKVDAGRGLLPGRQHEVRRRAKMGGLPADKLVPWGDGFRKEISRQAAETAALLGKESTKLNGLLGSLLKVGEKVPGLGSILELGSAAAMNPVSAWARPASLTTSMWPKSPRGCAIGPAPPPGPPARWGPTSRRPAG